jgi:Beta/Gamma crystallin
MSEASPAVEPNPEVILFEHPNFRGAHRHVFQRENDLSLTSKSTPIPGEKPANGNFAGVTSSIIVVRGTWLFFAKKNCDGHPEEISPKRLPNLKESQLADNEVLSLRPK